MMDGTVTLLFQDCSSFCVNVDFSSSFKSLFEKKIQMVDSIGTLVAIIRI